MYSCNLERDNGTKSVLESVATELIFSETWIKLSSTFLILD